MCNQTSVIQRRPYLPVRNRLSTPMRLAGSVGRGLARIDSDAGRLASGLVAGALFTGRHGGVYGMNLWRIERYPCLGQPVPPARP